MVDSIREQILTSFYSKLKEIQDDVADLKVFRTKTNRITEDDIPAIVMVDGSHMTKHDDSTSFYLSYEMEVNVEGYVFAESDDALGAAANALLAQIQKKITEDETLGGLSTDVQESQMDIVFERDSKKRFAEFNIVFLVEYQTKMQDPYSN